MEIDSELVENSGTKPRATANTVRWLQGQLADLDRQSEQIEAQRGVLGEMLARAKAESGGDDQHPADAPEPRPRPGHDGQTPAATRPGRGRGKPVATEIDLSDLEVSLEGTEDTSQMLVRIAEAVENAGKYLNVRELVKLIVRMGRSDATDSTMRVRVERALKRRSDLFEKVGGFGASYRYKGGGDAEINVGDP